MLILFRSADSDFLCREFFMASTNQLSGRESLILRIFWMFIFTLVWYVAEVVLAVVVILQLAFRTVQGKPNPELLQLGDSLSQYLAQIGQFGTFNTEEKPWPFADWPPSDAVRRQSAESAASKSGAPGS
jgi:uncharacterized membrane protein